MAHAAPTPPGSQRRNRIIGALLVLLGVAVLVVALISLGHPHGRRSADTTRTVTQPPPSGSASTTPKTSASSPTSRSSSSSSSSRSSKPSAPARPRAAVYILNNTNRESLAATVAGQLRAKGWTVLATENYSNDIISSAAYYDPSRATNRAAAEELRKEFPGIKRVVARFAQLPDAPIVLVLDDDYP